MHYAGPILNRVIPPSGAYGGKPPCFALLRPGCRRRGFSLIAFTLALGVLLGSVGLAVDIGRMYLAKSEAQSFVDAAAISAALKLNGTSGGLQAARDAAAATSKRWHFGTAAFTFDPNIDLTFGKAISDPEPWPTNPGLAAGYVCARVRTRVNLPLYLMPVLVRQFTSTIAASATAKQIQSNPGEGHYGPFSPFAVPIMRPPVGSTDPTSGPPRNNNDPFNMWGAEQRPLTTPITFRQPHGELYNIFWPNDTNVSNKWRDAEYVCSGEQYPAVLSLTTGAGLSNSNRGYLYNEASIVNSTIVAATLPPGKPLIHTGMQIFNDFLGVSSGVMEHNLTIGLGDRAATDSDSTSQWYQEYVANQHGNGQRIMLLPVNSGACGSTTFEGKSPVAQYDGENTCTFPIGDGTNVTTTSVPSYTAVGWGRFFLLPASYYYGINGNKGVCAEYIGPGMVEGSGAGNGVDVYVVRLIQ